MIIPSPCLRPGKKRKRRQVGAASRLSGKMAPNPFPTKLPVPTTAIVNGDGTPVKQFYDWMQAIWARTGGDNTNIDVLIGTLPGSLGSLIGRFTVSGNPTWVAFSASSPNSVVVLSPGAIQLLTISQLLDEFGNVQGDVLFRGATDWEVLPPVVNGFF